MVPSKAMRHALSTPSPISLPDHLNDPSLTAGQRRRIGLFQRVEKIVCARIEQLCANGRVDVTDAAALIVAPSAHRLLFGRRTTPNTSVVLGHRQEVYAFLSVALPAMEGTSFDPYRDLLQPAPRCCMRVLVLDHESLTVMSYGTFLTVNLSPNSRALA